LVPVFLALCLSTCGCQPPAAVDGTTVSAFTAFSTTAVSPQNATLKVAGVHIDTVMKTRREKGRIILDLVSNSDVIDHETYVEDSGGLSLEYAAGETFSPVIPLVRLPMHVGETWNWTGVLKNDGGDQPATAEIRTEASKIDTGGDLNHGLEVVVLLDLKQPNGTENVRRKLQFWLVEGHGVVRRSFGDESQREPAGGAP